MIAVVLNCAFSVCESDELVSSITVPCLYIWRLNLSASATIVKCRKYRFTEDFASEHNAVLDGVRQGVELWAASFDNKSEDKYMYCVFSFAARNSKFFWSWTPSNFSFAYPGFCWSLWKNEIKLSRLINFLQAVHKASKWNLFWFSIMEN